MHNAFPGGRFVENRDNRHGRPMRKSLLLYKGGSGNELVVMFRGTLINFQNVATYALIIAKAMILVLERIFAQTQNEMCCSTKRRHSGSPPPVSLLGPFYQKRRRRGYV